MKILILSVLAVAMIGLMMPSVDAKEFYPSINYRIEDIPTFCATDPPSENMHLSSNWIDSVETAVNYWETELQNSSEHPEVWEMKFERIQESEIKITEDYKFSHDTIVTSYEWPERCDIGLEYYDVPYRSGVLGVFIGETNSISIFDDSHMCLAETCENYDVEESINETIIHEIGHALGLGHFTFGEREKNLKVQDGKLDYPSIMYPMASNFILDSKITSRDISKMQEIYGSYGFYAFSEEKPTGLFGNENIIEGIPKPPGTYFQFTEISDPKIHEITDKHTKNFITISGVLEPYYIKPGQKVVFQMLSPDGNSETFVVTTRGGTFQLTLQLDNTYSRGVYTVTPSYLDHGFEEYEIQFEIVPKYEEIIIEKEDVAQTENVELSLDYDIVIPDKITLFTNTDSAVSGHLTPNVESPRSPVGQELYLKIEQYFGNRIYDTVLRTTTINEDLTFTFDVDVKDLDNIINSEIFKYSSKNYIEVGIDKTKWTKYDAVGSYLFLKESSFGEDADVTYDESKWVKNKAGDMVPNGLGNTIKIYDDKICVENYCSDNFLKLTLEGNIGMNTKNSISLNVKYCAIPLTYDEKTQDYICWDGGRSSPAASVEGTESTSPSGSSIKWINIAENVPAKNLGDGNFSGELLIRKSYLANSYHVFGVVNGAEIGRVGSNLMEVVKGENDETSKFEVKWFEGNRIEPTSDVEKSQVIPAWIKNNAGWWAEGQIDDNSFVQGIQFMIKENIISISNLPESSSETADSVPAWVKNNAGWWAEGQIDDNSFVKGIEYLVKVGIIQVS